MKRIILPIIMSLCALSIFAQSRNQNFIQTTTYTCASGTESIRQINYFDGLGRPVQTVQVGITPAGNDLVTLLEHDHFGREHRHWLPVPKANNNGNFVPAATFRPAATGFPSYGEGNPFTEIMYEASPLSRVLGVKNPGTAWHNRPARVEHGANQANEVKHFFINSAGLLERNMESGYYRENTLHRTTRIDEDGKRNTTFTDKLGRVIMTRQGTDHDTYFVFDDFGNLRYVLPPMASIVLGRGVHHYNSPTIRHFAFVYRYDDRNRLIKRRLPGADWVHYVLDRANRPILRQDGNMRANNQWKVMKYDRHGRLIYTAILRRNVTEAEKNRIRNSVITESFVGQSGFAGTGYSSSIFGIGLQVLTVYYYDCYSKLDPFLMPVNIIQMLVRRTREGFGTAHWPVPVLDSGTLRLIGPKGLLTGTKTRILGTNEFLWSVFYYDYRGRVVQTRSTNHVGGFDIVYKAYDFTGNVTQKLSEHSTNLQHRNPLTEHYIFTYDHAGRLIDTWYTLIENPEWEGTIGDVPPMLLSRNVYDELGRLVRRYRHNGEDVENFEYNIRNWTTRIQSGEGEFEQRIWYNRTDGTSGIGSLLGRCSFNGNISSTQFTSGGTSFTYHFTYDALNRLTRASSAPDNLLSISRSYEEHFTFDRNGNILTLRRYGRGDDFNVIRPPIDLEPIPVYPIFPPGRFPIDPIFPDVFSADFGTRPPIGTNLIDDLRMFYYGNQLIRVDDWAGSQDRYNVTEYHDLHRTGNDDFAHDLNGNMIKDLDRNIVTIRYNFLNLPELIQFYRGNQIINIYAADGRRLETKFITARIQLTTPLAAGETVTLPASNKIVSGTVFAGNIEYRYHTWRSFYEPHRIHNPEGFVNFCPNRWENNWYFHFDPWFHYFRRDHLGNVREVWRAPYIRTIRDFAEDWSVIWREERVEGYAIQRTWFYPSGLPKCKGMGRRENPRMYQGKEWVEMHGLDWYDFHWRWYNPSIGRFTTIDPLAELRPWESPYANVGNNFPNRIDPDGRKWKLHHERDGNRDIYHFTVTAVLYNRSSQTFDMDALATAMTEQINRIFTFDTEMYSVTMDFQVRVVGSPNEIRLDDHVFQIVNQGTLNEGVLGQAQRYGLSIRIGTDLVEQTLSGANTRTIAHELGHTGGLLDANRDPNWREYRRNNLMSQSLYLRNTHRVDPNSAYRLNRNQIKGRSGIVTNYRAGRLNQHSPVIQIIPPIGTVPHRNILRR